MKYVINFFKVTYAFMNNRIIRLFDVSRHLVVKNIRVFFELKSRRC